MTGIAATYVKSPVTLVTTAETAVLTAIPPTPAALLAQVGFSPAKIMVEGYLNVTAGTGTTSVQIRVKGGSGTGGAQLHAGSNDVYTIAAGATASIPYSEIDEGAQFSSASGYTYTVTIQQVGASGNGTVNFGTMKVTPLITEV